MSHLNIPLERHGRTTRRRSRRVVSLRTAIAFLIIAAAAWIALGAHFTRNALDAAAPDGTEVVAHFHPNARNWDDIKAALKNAPLISGRALTISDLEPFIAGEFSVFIRENGERAVALRVREDRVPERLLDKQRIISQEAAPGVLLLSSRLMPISGVETSLGWRKHIPLAWGPRLGSLHLLDEQTQASIHATSQGIELHFPKLPIQTDPLPPLPTNTIAALSTSMWTNLDLSPLSQHLERTSAPGKTALTHVIRGLEASGGTVMLTRSDAAMEVLVILPAQAVPEGEETAFLRAAAAIKRPKSVPFLLPDETSATEIIADPSTVTVEETVIAGAPVSRISQFKDGQGALLAGRTDMHVFFASDASLIEGWLRAPGDARNEGRCADEPQAFVDLASLLEHGRIAQRMYAPAFIEPLTRAYPELYIDNTLFSIRVLLCG